MIKEWLIGIGAALGAIIGIFLYGKNKGKSEQEAIQNENTLQSIQKGVQAKNAVISGDNDSIDKLVRDSTSD